MTTDLDILTFALVQRSDAMSLQLARFRPFLNALKRFGLLPVVLVLLCPCGSVQAQTENSNVVASVNADPITRQTLADATLARYGKDVVDNQHQLEPDHAGMQATRRPSF